MWAERMAGDKEGCLKLVLLQKNTSENTALVLQRVFCIIGCWSELICRPWSTNYEHLTFVSCSSRLDPLLAPAASIDTIQQQLCLLTIGEQWMFLLQVRLWQMSICKPSSSSLRYCCLQVSFLLFCQKCLSRRVSRRECLSLSCSKYSMWYLSSATFFPTSPHPPAPLGLLTRHSTSWLWEAFYSHRRLEGELSCACKVLFLFLLFCIPLAAMSPPPFPTRFFFQWSSISVPDVFLFHLLPTANFILCSQVAFCSYQGGDTFLQGAVFMVLYDQGKWIWVVVSNCARKQQRRGQMSPCCLCWEGIWVGRGYAAEGVRLAAESNVWNLSSKIHQS